MGLVRLGPLSLRRPLSLRDVPSRRCLRRLELHLGGGGVGTSGGFLRRRDGTCAGRAGRVVTVYVRV